jgi:hypothetical protein
MAAGAVAGEVGWRKHVQSRPWTPELIKLADDVTEYDEPIEMVAICDRTGSPQVAVRRETLLQAHRERGEMLRLKLEQRRQDLALAEALSSFGSSGSRSPSSRRSSPRSTPAPAAPQGETSYVTHTDLRGNVNFRNKGNPAYDLRHDPVRGTASSSRWPLCLPACVHDDRLGRRPFARVLRRSTTQFKGTSVILQT